MYLKIQVGSNMISEICLVSAEAGKKLEMNQNMPEKGISRWGFFLQNGRHGAPLARQVVEF